jgi:uncharacterized protein
MVTLEEAAEQFLANNRIAVAGVSRKKISAANNIYRRLRKDGYTVFGVNPRATQVEGDPCYARLAEIPGGVDAVIVVTKPEKSVEIVQQCVELGIRQVWLHRSAGLGSYHEDAVRLCEEEGIAVIPGACPIMFCRPKDLAHKCFNWFEQVSSNPPQPLNFSERLKTQPAPVG